MFEIGAAMRYDVSFPEKDRKLAENCTFICFSFCNVREFF